MNHIHLKSITSTQESFYDYFNEANEGQLLSADEQTQGVGQHGRTWTHVEHALSMSFSLKPAQNITLTSLELPVIVNKYFQKKYSSAFNYKWPNDLFNLEGQKCGGILINKKGEDDLVVGLGINLAPSSKDLSEFNGGSLFANEFKFECEELALELYEFILENRLDVDQIIHLWQQDCFHINDQVKIIDHDKEYLGIFYGIGKNGQALLKDGEEITEIYAGSLFFRS